MPTGLLALLVTLGVGENPPDVFTIRSYNLEIPIRFNEAKRAEIKELELHVSTNQGRTWTLVSRGKPDDLLSRTRPGERVFGFTAPGDGLYWFSVGAIDSTGRR